MIHLVETLKDKRVYDSNDLLEAGMFQYMFGGTLDYRYDKDGNMIWSVTI